MTNSSLAKIFISFLVMLTITYLIYHYYDNSNNDQIVTIYPDQSATKVRPQEAGGLIIPNANNLIYENLQSHQKVTKQVTLQDEPEKPLNIIHHKMQNEKIDDPIGSILASIIKSDKTELAKPNLEQNNNDLSVTEQKNLKTQGIASVPSLFCQNKVGLNIVKIAEKKNRFHQVKSRNKQNLYQIQLASAKSELEATQEGKRIKNKYIKILNNATIIVKKVQYKNGHVFYLILAGNYSNLNQAKAVCNKLSNNQQNCIVTNY